MKNLFKTLITVITVVCMLVTCTTAFAATANTVTQYNAANNVTVISTVSDVASGTVVTYLAAQDTNATEGIEADEIKFIDQKTSDGQPMTFKYSIDNGNTDWTPGTTITQVKYGSGNAAVSAALNNDATKDVKFSNITVSVKGKVTEDYETYVTLTPSVIGNGDTDVDVAIEAASGYEIKSIKIGDADEVTDTAIIGSFKVDYNETIEIEVEEITGIKVYLLDAEVTDGLTVYDEKTNQPLEVVTGVGYFTGNAAKVGIQFSKDIDGAHSEGYYEAVKPDGNAGYFAVQLAGTETDMTDVTAQKAYAEDAEGNKTLS